MLRTGLAIVGPSAFHGRIHGLVPASRAAMICRVTWAYRSRLLVVLSAATAVSPLGLGCIERMQRRPVWRRPGLQTWGRSGGRGITRPAPKGRLGTPGAAV